LLLIPVSNKPKMPNFVGIVDTGYASFVNVSDTGNAHIVGVVDNRDAPLVPLTVRQ
jgi:hypothetical protein